MRSGGELWDAKVVESPTKDGVWKVEYTDGGVVTAVDKEALRVYELGEQEWGTSEWYAVRHLVICGEAVEVASRECIRVPGTWKYSAGLKEYAVEVGSVMGKKMIQRTRPVYSIGAGGGKAEEEWAPELNRAGDVVTEWKRHGFGQVVEKNRPLDGQCMRGASDGSQRGKDGTYGCFFDDSRGGI